MLGTSPVLIGGKVDYVMRARVFVELSVVEEVTEELATLSLS